MARASSGASGPAVVALRRCASSCSSSRRWRRRSSFADAEVPEARLSEAVGALAGPTYDAVVDGVGAADGHRTAGTRCAGATPPTSAAPGFGLLDELERAGLDVAADEYFHVPVTDHRVRPRADADAQIHLATGSYVDRWRARARRGRGGDVRPAHRRRRSAESPTSRAPVLDRLRRRGPRRRRRRSSTPTCSAPRSIHGCRRTTSADLTELLDLGQPMAVFIAPPDAEP